MQLKTLSRPSFLALSLCLLTSACGGGSGTPDSGGLDGGCEVGEPGCACYGNRTCNSPSVCSVSQICVLTGSPGSGGAAPATGGAGGGAGTSGLGGAAVPDGATGGVTGFDAAAADVPLGSGGISYPGVDAAAGGAPGSGGVPGTGGRLVDAGAGGAPADAGPEPVLSGPCLVLGELNCVGHAQKGMMMCDGSKWVPNGACTGTLLCDTTPGATQGTCVAPVAECASQQPGYSYCSATTKVTCGPDLVTTSRETCPFACTAGQCTGECVPSSRDCDGQTPLSCATNATWLRGTTCTGDCNKGTCCGTSTPTNCAGTCVDPQTNNANCGGCGTVCSTTGGKSCRAGLCQCPEGMTDCGGTCVSLTSSSANCGVCGNACIGGRTCQASLCACPSGTLECDGVCINVQTDPNNCGGCGLSCGTSTCYAASCGGDNLLTNGDFSDGSTNWRITQADTGVAYGMSGSSYCISLPAYSIAYFGWGDSLTSVPIAKGYGYTFSYTVSSSDALYAFEAKIGHTVSPYTVVFSNGTDEPGPTPTTFSHSFTPTADDTGAGVVFYLYAYSAGATACFDDVSLVRH